jgi:hypothetical protein
MRIKVVGQSLCHQGTWHKDGAELEVPDQDGADLVALKRAIRVKAPVAAMRQEGLHTADLKADGDAPAAAAPAEPRQKRTYNRRDLVAEK